MPTHASFLYSRNVANLLALLGKDGRAGAGLGATRSCSEPACCATGAPVHGPTAEAAGHLAGARRDGRGTVNGILQYLTVFVLAAFVGIEVVSKVPSILHTPLMSGSNAIHGVILVGAILVLGGAHTVPEQVLGFLAVFLATLNVVGGFVVTDRMLEMFKGKPGDRPAGRPGRGRRRVGRRHEPGHLHRPVLPGGGDRASSWRSRAWRRPAGPGRATWSARPACCWPSASPSPSPDLHHLALILVAMVIGVVVAVPAARLVKMTAMPQMVAIFNGVGGGAAALVSITEFVRPAHSTVGHLQGARGALRRAHRLGVVLRAARSPSPSCRS